MTAPTIQAKFLRAFEIQPTPSNGTDGSMSLIWRLVLEFWGFCVNGSNDLVNPGLGSVPTGSFTNLPGGWLTGSTVLLKSGSDGTTSAGLPYFNVTGSQPFSPNLVGKWLTTWQSGSTSTDDSIYLITQWLNSSSIVLDVTYGGTSIGPSGSVPQLTSRNNINYRVVDYVAAAAAGAPYSNGQYVVFQFPRANQVNVGQVNSQWQLLGRSANSNISQMKVVLSPSGSWNGSAFSDPSDEIYPEVNSGPGSGGWATPDWFHNSGGGHGYVTIIAGLAFLICQAGSEHNNGMMPNGGSSFHVEVPIRLYPRANDPNPICANNWGNMGVFTAASVGYGYAHFKFPSPYDTFLTRRFACLVPGYTGAAWQSQIWGSTQQTLDVTRWASMFFNQFQSKFLLPAPILSMPTINGQADATGQFSLARARFRSARYIAGGYPYYMRVGDDNDRWIHVGGGVMWPWDNAIVNKRQLFSGF